MADPVALAAQRIAERAFDQGVRISGLGGEVARGFYYVGQCPGSPLHPQGCRAARLVADVRQRGGRAGAAHARVRGMGARRRQRGRCTRRCGAAATSGSARRMRSTSRHRMQRWAGATDIGGGRSAPRDQPDARPGFLEHRRAADAAGQGAVRGSSRALQMELDPELGPTSAGRPPRPRPRTRTRRGGEPALDAMTTGKRLARKAMQRVRRGNRPPAGGTVLAAKVVEHWRDEPGLLEPLATLDFLSESGSAACSTGRVEPRPSSVAFLTNLVGGDHSSSDLIADAAAFESRRRAPSCASRRCGHRCVRAACSRAAAPIRRGARDPRRGCGSRPRSPAASCAGRVRLQPDRAGVVDVRARSAASADDERQAECHRLQADVSAGLPVAREDEDVGASRRTRRLRRGAPSPWNVTRDVERRARSRAASQASRSLPSPTTSRVTSRSRVRSSARMMSRSPFVRTIRPT